MAKLEQIKSNTKTYTSKQQAYRGLLGGIGTGNISLDASGRMCDFETMNHASKNLKLPYTFFSMWSKIGEEDSKAVVLAAAPRGISSKALGHPSGEVYGLPHMDSSTVETKYPFYEYEFKKKNLPLKVELEAYTPFIPLDAKNSGIPAFTMTYKITNNSSEVAQVAVAGTFLNYAGLDNYNGFDHVKTDGTNYNEKFSATGISGVFMGVKDMDEGAINYGSLAIATANDNITMKPYWQETGWFDGGENFWQDFAEDGMLEEDVSSEAISSTMGVARKQRVVGSISAMETINPGETKEYTFYIGWNFPNTYGWSPDGHDNPDWQAIDKKTWQNYYTNFWKDAKDVLLYLKENEKQLRSDSENFALALYDSTLSAQVIETLVSSITVIRSTTCFRLSDGSFYAWEGCFDDSGSCPGTCTHVWNYAQTMAFLFPELEISARRTEFLEETDDEGAMMFRALRKINSGKHWDMLPAADGQLGCVTRVYREWQLTGDDEFLKEVWEGVGLVLEYAIKNWDLDGDGVLDARQHNTYDIEFYGISSLTNAIFYAALKAGTEMARYLGEDEKAARWEDIRIKGSAKMDELLWNGEYYKQLLPEGVDIDKYKYQYGDGCITDQMLGQVFAHVYGLGYILPKDHVKKAVKSIFDYNYLEELGDHTSIQRVYAYSDEGGVLTCSWPHGGRPKKPFVYSDEVWTGIEYQIATNLIYEGYVDEALKIVDTLRHRYNGDRRSPYNEIECGNHYARSMAAWGILVAMSGYDFDLPNGKIGFNPVVGDEAFKCFYSNGKSWGTYEQEVQADGTITRKIKPLYGNLDGIKVNDGECEILN